MMKSAKSYLPRESSLFFVCNRRSTHRSPLAWSSREFCCWHATRDVVHYMHCIWEFFPIKRNFVQCNSPPGPIIPTQRTVNAITAETKKVEAHTIADRGSRTEGLYLCSVSGISWYPLIGKQLCWFVSVVKASWRSRPIKMSLNSGVPWLPDNSETSYLAIHFTCISQIENVTTKLINMQKIMIVSSRSNAPKYIIHTRNENPCMTESRCQASAQCNSTNLVRAIHNKPPEPLGDQTELHNAANELDRTFNLNQRDELRVPSGFFAHPHKILEMLAQLWIMWDGHPVSINAVENQIELEKSKDCPIHSALTMHVLREENSREKKSKGFLQMDGLETAQTGWMSPIMFVPKKDFTFDFSVDYQKLNSLEFQDSHLIMHMDECIDPLGNESKFQHWTQRIDICKSKSLGRIATKRLSPPTTTYSALNKWHLS